MLKQKISIGKDELVSPKESKIPKQILSGTTKKALISGISSGLGSYLLDQYVVNGAEIGLAIGNEVIKNHLDKNGDLTLHKKLEPKFETYMERKNREKMIIPKSHYHY